MALLSQAGQELVRNRTAQVVDAGRLAKGYTSDGATAAWHGSDDWRVRLGSSIALARHGAKSAPCAPEVRALLFSESPEVRKLAETTLRGNSPKAVVLPPVQCKPQTPRLPIAVAEEEQPRADAVDARHVQRNVERVRQLFASGDFRMRLGALEALGRQSWSEIAQHAADVAALLTDSSVEVQQAAATVLKRAGSTAAPSVADVLCKETVSRPIGEQLLLQLVSGDRRRAEAMLQEARQRAQPKVDPDAPEDLVLTVFVAPDAVQEPQQPSAIEALQAEVSKFEASAVPLQPVPPANPLPTAQRPRFGASQAVPSPGPLEEMVEVRKRASASDPIALLNSGTRHLCISVLSTIGRKTVKEALPFLNAVVDKLQDEDEHVSAAAADTLGALGSKGLSSHARAAEMAEAISAKLTDSHSFVRQASARALGRLGAEQTAAALARLLEDDDLQVQREAMLALGAFPPTATGNVVTEHLRNTDAGVRAAAKKALLLSASSAVQGGILTQEAALTALRPHLEPVLSHESPEVRRSAAEVVERVARAPESGSEAAPGTAFGDSTSFSARTGEATGMASLMTTGNGLLERGDAGTASLAASCSAALLEDADEEVREAAARRLGNLGAAAASSSPALARCLEDTSPTVRKAAAEVLAELGEAHGSLAAPRAAHLLQHPLQTVRRAASYALSGLGEAAQAHEIDRNIALLTDPDPTLRSNAVEALDRQGALGKLDDAQVALVVALHIDRHWCVRLAVADALCHWGSHAVQLHQAALKILVKDIDWRVQRAASAALKDATGQAAIKKQALCVEPNVCKCGNIFMTDCDFCRKCGAKRGEDHEPQPDSDELADVSLQSPTFEEPSFQTPLQIEADEPLKIGAADQDNSQLGASPRERSGSNMNAETDAEQSGREASEAAAALKIQALHRGRSQRRKTQQLQQGDTTVAAKRSVSYKETVEDEQRRHTNKAVTFGVEEQVAATRIQSSLRARGARKEAEARRHEKREAAAMRIQAQHRDRKSKRESLLEKQREEAAVRIQSIHRGRRTRTESHHQRRSSHSHHHKGRSSTQELHERHDPPETPESTHQGNDREAAALRIQRLHRGRMVRREVKDGDSHHHHKHHASHKEHLHHEHHRHEHHHHDEHHQDHDSHENHSESSPRQRHKRSSKQNEASHAEQQSRHRGSVRRHHDQHASTVEPAAVGEN